MDNALKFERLRKACARAKLDIDAVIEECRSGRSQFHDADGGCCVTSIDCSGPHRVLTVTVLGGTLDGVRALEKIVTDFAKLHGCDSIRTIGRPGFDRVFENLGENWRPIGVLYEKRLKD